MDVTTVDEMRAEPGTSTPFTPPMAAASPSRLEWRGPPSSAATWSPPD